jgi:hypothetical protein
MIAAVEVITPVRLAPEPLKDVADRTPVFGTKDSLELAEYNAL